LNSRCVFVVGGSKKLERETRPLEITSVLQLNVDGDATAAAAAVGVAAAHTHTHTPSHTSTHTHKGMPETCLHSLARTRSFIPCSDTIFIGLTVSVMLALTVFFMYLNYLFSYICRADVPLIS